MPDSDRRAAYPPTRDPAFAARAGLRAVSRAAADLRRGDPVLVRPRQGPALLTLALEQATDDRVATLTRLGGGMVPTVLLTGQRARSLGLPADGIDTVALTPERLPPAALLRDLADPTRLLDGAALPPDLARPRAEAPLVGDSGSAVTRLLKIARLLPAALVAEIDRPLGAERLLTATDVVSAAAADIDGYDRDAALSLEPVSSATVPLYGAEATRIIAFRPADGGLEHLAILIGEPEREEAPTVRLHSECFTGDLLDSLRCDCGPQLRGAIAELAERGSGIVLYLAQEGRGIGLVNKLRAYTLQDGAFDTVDANEMLGYDDDERIYLPAVEMLRHLGIGHVRLMTNNPNKLAQLAACGIAVTERVAHAFPANGHNEFYLRTKKLRSGHLF